MQLRKLTKVPTAAEALRKAGRYCAYQERAHQEVRDKLYGWGLHRKEVEEVIVMLIERGFLNEERFARAYAGGHFRMKQWGRLRIIRGLEQKKVSGPCIQLALTEIEEEDYRATMEKLIRTKSLTLKRASPYERHEKIARYLTGKGYEPELVREMLRSPGD